MVISYKNIKVFGVNINSVDYHDLLLLINQSIFEKNQIAITGVNVNSINLTFSNKDYLKILNTFEVLHPDGIGVYIYTKLKHKTNENIARITGSDFYLEFIKEIEKKCWKVFFFGEEISTLEKLENENPKMNIVGYQNGFSYNSEELINRINDCDPDIVIVGMGAPKQEEWVWQNRVKLNSKVIIAVGEGIKIFTNTKKRGYIFVRKLGFEWFVRLMNNPIRYWKRYVIGIPLFLFRAITYKVQDNV